MKKILWIVWIGIVVVGPGISETRAQGTGGYRGGGWGYGQWGWFDSSNQQQARSAQSAAASQQAMAQRTAAAQQSVNASVASARAAQTQRRDHNAALLQHNAERRWLSTQNVMADQRAARRDEESRARQLEPAREAIARQVSDSWSQLAFKSKSAFPTDMGGVVHSSGPKVPGISSTTRTVKRSVQNARGTAVRAAFNQPDIFTAKWFQQNASAWIPPKWADPNGLGRIAEAAWRFAGWPRVSTWLGLKGDPISYDYGVNIVLENGMVYVDGQPIASQAIYHQEAVQLAQANPGAENQATEWMPIGVFGLVAEGQTESKAIINMAINNLGIIRGNYFNPSTNSVVQLRGSVDLKTQRVAGAAGDQKDPVFQAGLFNLTQDIAPCLVHFGDQTQQWLLVRIRAPEENSQPPPPETPPQQDQNRGVIVVQVPGDADLWFDGFQSRQTGSERRFSTPQLDPGTTYSYDIRAHWTENGVPVDRTKRVTIRAGETSTVNFTESGS